MGGKGRWEALDKLSEGDGWEGEMGGITQVKNVNMSACILNLLDEGSK